MRGFPEDRIQSALKIAFLLGLQDRAHAAMLILTNAETLDDLLMASSRSHTKLAIANVIEPLVKRARVHQTGVVSATGSTPKALQSSNAARKRSGRSYQRDEREEPQTAERYKSRTEARRNAQGRRTIKCYACEGNHTIRDCPEYELHCQLSAS